MADELEYWPDSASRFTHIVALHSELIALSTTGQLHQWRWSDPEPYRHPDVSEAFIKIIIMSQYSLVSDIFICMYLFTSILLAYQFNRNYMQFFNIVIV